jgi:integrase
MKLRTLCHEKAAQDDDGAVAVLLGMLMGLRAGEIVSRTARDVDDEGRILWVDDNDAIAFTTKTKASKRPVPVWEEVQPHLLARVKDKLPGALLFQAESGGPHWRDWVRKQTKRLCNEAKVPVVCAHSLRGFAATLNLLSGVPLSKVAAALGHESSSTTLQSYAAPGTREHLASQHAQALLGPVKAPEKAS